MTTGYNVLLRNAQLDAITTFAGAGAKLRIYGGVQPATGGAVTTQLVNDFTGARRLPWQHRQPPYRQRYQARRPAALQEPQHGFDCLKRTAPHKLLTAR